MLKTRARTGAVIALLVLLLLHFSYLPYTLKLFAAALNIIGTFELYRAAGCPKKAPFGISTLLAVSMPFLLPEIPLYHVIVAIIFMASLVVFFPLAAHVENLTFQTEGTAFCISLFISICFSTIPILRTFDYGLYYVILVVLTSVVTEITAYFAGRSFGKHKLAPRVSPGKTIEGAIGGTLLAYLIILEAGTVVSRLTDTPINYALFSCYLVLASLVGQVGDLAMSLIKRATRIKDFGKLMPGHGGVLDRFDSQLFIAPFTLTFYILVQHIF